MAKKNPFLMFKPEVKTAFIKALDAEIKYRELTMGEDDAFNARMLKDSGIMEGQTPVIDLEQATQIKYEKVSTMLVEPQMTADELLELGNSAKAAIEEILDLLAPDSVDEEGN